MIDEPNLAEQAELARARPSVIHRPKLMAIGDQWCVWLGDTPDDGLRTFGPTVAAAMAAFDAAFETEVTPAAARAALAPRSPAMSDAPTTDLALLERVKTSLAVLGWAPGDKDWDALLNAAINTARATLPDTRDAEIARLRAALEDALAGWRYIRKHHGDLHGVGWDRVETAARAALAPQEPNHE